MHIVLDGGGVLYQVFGKMDNKDDTTAPGFSRDVDVKRWKSLSGKRFKEIIVVLEDE